MKWNDYNFSRKYLTIYKKFVRYEYKLFNIIYIFIYTQEFQESNLYRYLSLYTTFALNKTVSMLK